MRSRATYNPDVGKPKPLALAPPSLAVLIPAGPSSLKQADVSARELTPALELTMALALELMPALELTLALALTLIAAREVSGSNRSVPGSTLESHGAPRLARSAAEKGHSCATPMLAPMALALELPAKLVLALVAALAAVLALVTTLAPEPEPVAELASAPEPEPVAIESESVPVET